ncbi:nucleoside diphosphate kinase regulator [Polaromonas sp.]|jgi:regulator of nucleoside diphosphate kinase|uniref:nucleoside diphosphate kinase regulator n=1 Tax=Polaromonas sp. TaxID=1869339 RepID=UPI0037C4FA66
MFFSNQPARLLTELDHIRISKLLQRPGASPQTQAAVDDLIHSAELISSYQVPANVVTMYSQVLMADGHTGEQRKLTLCYPHDADPAAGFVSVLSPVGAGLLGLKMGDTARWPTPDGGTATAKIVEILFQPEESGDYLL